MRIAVVGTSGSGKTTLGRALARDLNLPFVELDAINWQAGWRDLNSHDPEEFKRRVGAALGAEAWVSDGNYGAAVGPSTLARATHLIWLDYDRATVMRRVIWRSILRVLDRKELWPGTGNRERFLQWFTDKDHPIRWAWRTHALRRARYEALIADPANAHLKVFRLRHPRDADDLATKLAAPN
ncbi:MAG: AAA family ATPase [Proteobacteria bacterium]|nr:AAA family ATPase [Pseudomonadota bacterium]